MKTKTPEKGRTLSDIELEVLKRKRDKNEKAGLAGGYSVKTGCCLFYVAFQPISSLPIFLVLSCLRLGIDDVIREHTAPSLVMLTKNRNGKNNRKGPLRE